jgi:hypothetical protein
VRAPETRDIDANANDNALQANLVLAAEERDPRSPAPAAAADSIDALIPRLSRQGAARGVEIVAVV